MISQKDILDHFIEFEGDVPHFYLDSKGLVTVGVGCQVFNKTFAMSLPMLSKETSELTRADKIGIEYDEVKELEKDRAISYYSLRTLYYLPTIERFKLFNQRIKGFATSINTHICQLEKFPEAAQLVMLDMCFTLGTSGLMEHFPKFSQAFLAKNWIMAANESQRESISISRNQWTEKTLISLIN